jgi:HSP20 family molecular chaperone IbpA
MTNASYAATRFWPVARIVETPDEFRATVDLAGIDDTALEVELVERTVRLTGKGADRHAPRLELRFELPQDTDLDHLRVLEEEGRLLIRAPHRAPRHRRLEIEHAQRVIHADATPS